MGDEHGSVVLAPLYDCEEPSAPAGFLSSRPAGACLLKETTMAPGRSFASKVDGSEYLRRFFETLQEVVGAFESHEADVRLLAARGV